MLREVYTTGGLRDFSNSEGCRGTRKKKRKFCLINRVYGIIEFIDKMIKGNKKGFDTFLKLGIKKEELIDLYQTKHI